MTNHQTFIDPGAGTWLRIDFLPGVELMPLAQPVPEGSVHRARLAAGTTIPGHTHPADEFVIVLSGTIETGGRTSETGTCWTTPPGTAHGTHVPVPEVEFFTRPLEPLRPSAG